MNNSPPKYHDLIIPTIRALKALGGSGSNDEIVDKIIEIEGYPEKIQNMPHRNGRDTIISYNAAWARTYLKWYGALENSQRGVWSITDVGEKLKEGDAEKVKTRGKELSKKPKKDAEEKQLATTEDEISEPDEQSNWRDELISTLLEIKPDAFERLCQRILRESGFTRVEVTGKSSDGGIDGVGVLRVNLLSFHVLFQCKRYKGSVGSKEVRDFRGSMVGRSDKGFFLTTGSFTSEARKEATRDGAPAIDLIDGDDLCELLKQFGLGVETEMIEKVGVKKEWFKGI